MDLSIMAAAADSTDPHVEAHAAEHDWHAGHQPS